MSHHENCPFLCSSSHLFNQKRLELAKANQAMENSRRRRLFQGVQEAVSAEINLRNGDKVDKVEKVEKMEMDGKLDDVFSREQQAINRFVQELLTLREQFSKYSKAYKKIHQTDISQEDQKMLIKILREHGYISQDSQNTKLSQIFKQILKKHNKPTSTSPAKSPQKPDPYLQQALLQNYRPSRFPIQNQLCSIAHDPQPNPSLIINTNINTNNNNNRCSLQLDLDHVNHHDEEVYERDEEEIGAGGGKVSKRYCQQQDQDEQDEESGSGVSKSRSKMGSEGNSSQYSSVKYSRSGNRQKPTKPKQQPRHKSPNSPLFPKTHPPILTTNTNTSKNIFKIQQIGCDTLMGKIGQIKCDIHWSSVEKVIWEYGIVRIWVWEFGELGVGFECHGLYREFMNSLIAYVPHQQQQ